MFNSIRENAGHAERILIICGILHGNQLAESFRQIGGASVEIEIWPPL